MKHFMEKGSLPVVAHLLQTTLRSLCSDSEWVYSVFWRILPRNYPPPKWDSKAGPSDRSKGNKRNWILVWEDGFCDFAACCKDGVKESCYQTKDPVSEGDATLSTLQPELFFKMSHDVYNYGEGLMGKVAADNSHKWIYREPTDAEMAFLSPWQGSLDPHPRTWEAQFRAGIQTIAVVAVGEGLLQLGSTKKIIEDLNFVILLQRRFNYLQSIPGVFAPHPLSELLGATRKSSRKNTRQLDNIVEEPIQGNTFVAVTNDLRFRNTGGEINKQPILVHENQLLLGAKRALDSDNSLPSCSKFPAIFHSMLAAASIGPSQDSNEMFCSRSEISPAFKASILDNDLLLPSPNSPVAVANFLPSMSSLDALLSKLPDVSASDLSVPPPYASSSSQCCNPGRFNSYVEDQQMSSMITKTMPPTTPDHAAEGAGEPSCWMRSSFTGPLSTDCAEASLGKHP